MIIRSYFFYLSILLKFLFCIEIPPITLCLFPKFFFFFRQTCPFKKGEKKPHKSFRGKALCETVSVTQINQIKELRHSMAESLIIIQARVRRHTYTHTQARAGLVL